MEQMKAQIEMLEEVVSEKIVGFKELKEQWQDAELESVRIAEQLTKYTRTGRQPNNKKDKREKRRNRSFDDYDDEELVGGGITIPEDCGGYAKGSPEESFD